MQRGLSGGQKVKVVLAAATWRRPHILILDEPVRPALILSLSKVLTSTAQTNYLDRESLAALIEALKSFEGGVLIITRASPLRALCARILLTKCTQTTVSSPRTSALRSGP